MRRALDSRARHPFLADPTAAEIPTRLGGDCSRFPMPASSVTDIALRSRKLDDVVRQFVAAHPDAVVLDLGAGLDGRMVRVAPPATMDWYDLRYQPDPREEQARRSRPRGRQGCEPPVTGAVEKLIDPGWLRP